jgi:xylulose-5-phosphate/fructose-6-phosphate phosphoketolase
MTSREPSRGSSQSPLSNDELRLIDAWWRAQYPSVGGWCGTNWALKQHQPEHWQRLLAMGHQSALCCVVVNLIRFIKVNDMDMIFMAG